MTINKQIIEEIITRKEETAKKMGCYHDTEWIFTEIKDELNRL